MGGGDGSAEAQLGHRDDRTGAVGKRPRLTPFWVAPKLTASIQYWGLPLASADIRTASSPCEELRANGSSPSAGLALSNWYW